MDTTPVNGIDKIGSVGRVDRNTAVQTVRICDELDLSAVAQKEAQKMEQWVQMLHEMPEIRPDALEAASTRELPSPMQLAEKLARDC